jgi:hypothetical protein
MNFGLNVVSASDAACCRSGTVLRALTQITFTGTPRGRGALHALNGRSVERKCF